MKIYVRSNTEPMQTVNVVIDFDVVSDGYYDEPIAASLIICGDDVQVVDSDGENLDRMLVDGSGQFIDDVFESLLSTIRVTADTMGIRCLYEDVHEEVYDGKRAKSKYMDFCMNSKYGTNTVRFVFFIRISNHRNRHENQELHAKRRLEEYRESGISGGGNITPELRAITINRQSYPTISAAMRRIREIFNELKASESQ